MTEFSAFAPPCMVAGPNGLDLKKIQIRVKFKICFKFGLKIKKIPGSQAGNQRVNVICLMILNNLWSLGQPAKKSKTLTMGARTNMFFVYIIIAQNNLKPFTFIKNLYKRKARFHQAAL
jgi:hypothetical protein